MSVSIGAVTGALSQAGGGVSEALRLLTGEFARQGVSATVYGLADAAGAPAPEGWPDSAAKAFPATGPRSFGYAGGMAQALLGGGHDLVHLHGIWGYPSIAAERWRRATGGPTVISPHGMLDPWALRNSHWKKVLAGALYQRGHLRRATCLHALCEAEAAAFRAYGLTGPVAVIPNGVELPGEPLGTPPPWAETLPAGARILLFLGRIHPKKGLPALLEGWAEAMASRALPEDWILAIAGWDQGGHEARLKAMASELGIAERVRFPGPQFGTAKRQSLERADAFVLPSLSEGLPMAVLEAWAHALPVLMTPQCNLPEGFAEDAALQADPTPASLADALGTLTAMTDAERRAMAGRGRALAAGRFGWPAVAAELRTLYDWALGGGARPATVDPGNHGRIHVPA